MVSYLPYKIYLINLHIVYSTKLEYKLQTYIFNVAILAVKVYVVC